MRHEPVDAKSQKRHRMPHNLNEAILETFPELACLAVASHPLHLSSIFWFFSVLSGFIER
jgi:hypothetical protein